ncbi:MAG: hypothetical protein M1824_002040, partial [Vezdaea acicularis]
MADSSPPNQEALIQAALKAIQQGNHTSVAQAAKRYAIPYRTLYDRAILGRKSYAEAHASKQNLTPAQEAYLVKYCTEMEDKGVPARKDLIRAKAQAILRRNTHPTAVIG